MVWDGLCVRAEDATRKAEFLPQERAEASLADFRDHFGPDRLAASDPGRGDSLPNGFGRG